MYFRKREREREYKRKKEEKAASCDERLPCCLSRVLSPVHLLKLLLNFDLHFNIHRIIVENLRAKGTQSGVVFTRRRGARVSNLPSGPLDHVTHACKQTLTLSSRMRNVTFFVLVILINGFVNHATPASQSAFCLDGKRKLLSVGINVL